MGFEEARQAVEQSTQTPDKAVETSSDSGAPASAAGNGDLAPDSSAKSNDVLDLTKAEKFLWEGKEMTPEELRRSMLRQQDYTKKTQAHAEERRRFDQERQDFIRQQEETEKYNSNLDADVQNVLRDPSLETRFKEIYPEKYHAHLEKALTQAFGESGNPKRNESLLEQRLKSIEGRFQSQDMARSKQAFETEVQSQAEILDSSIQRLSDKYPHADEDSVLARAEHMAAGLKKDENFKDNFFGIMEKLYKENHKFHEQRYQQIYKQNVEKQKQKNAQGRDIGRGGATPGTAPTKIKFKDVKNHILSGLDR
jgi:hypothetical protein